MGSWKNSWKEGTLLWLKKCTMEVGRILDLDLAKLGKVRGCV
mgnify:CR=1 FL=1